jgi:hypothetical protein
MVVRFVLGRSDVPNRSEQPSRVEPIHPLERGDSTASSVRQGPLDRITSVLKRPMTDSASALKPLCVKTSCLESYAAATTAVRER